MANSTTNQVTLSDVSTGQQVRQVAVPREPYHVAVTPDETLAVVSNLLPTGRATDPTYGSVVSLIDLEKKELAGNISLPPGASTVRQVCISADGRWAYVVHCVGRTSVPSTQLERGWVNTNAFSIIDLENRQLLCHPLARSGDEGCRRSVGSRRHTGRKYALGRLVRCSRTRANRSCSTP